MSFLIQVDIFLVLCIESDFLLKPRHFRYNIMRLWISFDTVPAGEGSTALFLADWDESAGPPLGFCWYSLKKGHSNAVGIDRSSCSLLELSNTFMLGGVVVPCYCSPYGFTENAGRQPHDWHVKSWLATRPPLIPPLWEGGKMPHFSQMGVEAHPLPDLCWPWNREAHYHLARTKAPTPNGPSLTPACQRG